MLVVTSQECCAQLTSRFVAPNSAWAARVVSEHGQKIGIKPLCDGVVNSRSIFFRSAPLPEHLAHPYSANALWALAKGTELNVMC